MAKKDSHDGGVRKAHRKQFDQLQRKRAEATSRPLNDSEVTHLLSLRCQGRPVYESAELFHSDVYAEIRKLRGRALTPEDATRLLDMRNADGKPKHAEESVKIPEGSFRIPTEQQAKDLRGVESYAMYRPATQKEANRLYVDIHSRLISEERQIKK